MVIPSNRISYISSHTNFIHTETIHHFRTNTFDISLKPQSIKILLVNEGQKKKYETSSRRKNAKVEMIGHVFHKRVKKPGVLDTVSFFWLTLLLCLLFIDMYSHIFPTCFWILSTTRVWLPNCQCRYKCKNRKGGKYISFEIVGMEVSRMEKKISKSRRWKTMSSNVSPDPRQKLYFKLYIIYLLINGDAKYIY